MAGRLALRIYATAACLVILSGLLARSWAWQTPATDPPLTPAAAQFFEQKVRPILADNCWRCHGGDKHKGELRLDSRTAMLAGGDRGPAIVPGHPDKSLLVKAIAYTDQELKMPPSQKAYEDLVDRLLNSPRYGEKWARQWLDLVRFAETNSYERDNPKPNAWRYRDYVIRAFNNDLPYDRFIREQLAGDEYAPGDIDALIATAYYRLGIWDDEPSDPVQARYDGLDDLVATTGQVFLGLTLDCARCHNHKIDPLAQKDYYRLLAFFHNINHFRNGGPTDETPIFASADARDAFLAATRKLAKQRKEI